MARGERTHLWPYFLVSLRLHRHSDRHDPVRKQLNRNGVGVQAADPWLLNPRISRSFVHNERTEPMIGVVRLMAVQRPLSRVVGNE